MPQVKVKEGEPFDVAPSVGVKKRVFSLKCVVASNMRSPLKSVSANAPQPSHLKTA